MADTDSNIKIREHYRAIGLTDRIKAALTTIAPESQVLTVAQLLHSTSSIREAFSLPPNWLAPLGSMYPLACWMLTAA